MADRYEFTEDEFLYPSRIDMPEAATDRHRKAVADLIARLEHRYADAADVYVSGDLKVYWEKWNPYEVEVPDCFVVFGVPKRDRDKYLGWEEGRMPAVVIEVASREGRDDLGGKFRAYQDDWAVDEYFVFDPTGAERGPPLTGYRRTGNRLVPLVVANGVLTSRRLGVTLAAAGDRLVLRDTTTGQEVVTAAEAEVARLRAELDALRNRPPA